MCVCVGGEIRSLVSSGYGGSLSKHKRAYPCAHTCVYVCTHSCSRSHACIVYIYSHMCVHIHVHVCICMGRHTVVIDWGQEKHGFATICRLSACEGFVINFF